jgi:hypothetical protein
MDNIKTIGRLIEGHFNNALDKVGLLPDDTKALGKIRFEKCSACESLRNNRYCGRCGCDMQAGTKVIDVKCPVGKW